MIDKNEELQGKIICGKEIYGQEILKQFIDKKVCIIVFPFIEKDVENMAGKILNNFDVIVSDLIDTNENDLQSYSQHKEDVLLYQIIDKIGIKEPSYMDIGVCHPVIHNNTYLFYRMGWENGVLIEPNPDMCELIKMYRPNNKILNIGACASADTAMRYYKSSNPTHAELNTFIKSHAEQHGLTDYIDIEVMNINEIFDLHGTPDILDMDTEGFDLELIKALDTEKYRIKIICIEDANDKDEFKKILAQKNYTHYISLSANSIFIANEFVEKVKNELEI